jgi:arylsulfatase A-like enzyme
MPNETVAQTPNILVMMVDQMRADYMGCAGNPWIQTPGLDRLARQGTRFSQCVTSVPVCMAARHSFMTGHRCATHGRFANNVPDPDPLHHTLMQVLGFAGYRTRAIGKMHFRPVRRHHGFHRMELMEEIPDFRQDDEYLMYLNANGYGNKREVHGVRNLLYHLPQVSVIPEEHHGSTWVADRTIDFLGKNRDKPFFCWSSWIAPHPPWNPPEPFASMYANQDMPLPVHWDRNVKTLPPRHRGMTNFGDMCDAPPERLQRVKALYGASVSLIDTGVGRILDALDDLGLAENTLVVFTSDHGEMLGDHQMWQKGVPFEASVNVPLLARLPGKFEAGVVNEDLVTLLDLMPTMLDVAKVDYPGEKPLPGASLIGRTGGGLAQSRDAVVIEIGRGESRWLSLRSQAWKYTYWLADGWQELYHLEADPEEANNLLLGEADEAHCARARAMRDRLRHWEAKHGFADSLDDAGQWVNLNLPPVDPALMRTNGQFPRWVDRLADDEKDRMENRGETVVNAIKYEETFELEETNLKAFKEHGGSLEGTAYENLPGE